VSASTTSPVSLARAAPAPNPTPERAVLEPGFMSTTTPLMTRAWPEPAPGSTAVFEKLETPFFTPSRNDSFAPAIASCTFFASLPSPGGALLVSSGATDTPV
jgi:hypothetical protein